jgi:hypothetical protein
VGIIGAIKNAWPDADVSFVNGFPADPMSSRPIFAGARRKSTGGPMGTEGTLQMEIGYGEEGVSLTVKVDATPNQEKIQRAHTLEQTLKRQNIPYDCKDQLVRVYLRNEGDLERTIECFRIFEKQDKSREIRLNVHKKIATELETKLKSIFPPPEAAISVKMQALIAS